MVYSKAYGQWLKLQSPMFGSHITVVRPQEVDLHHSKWRAYEGESVEIEYSSLERHWEFWSLNVYSRRLVDIRRELGLRTDFRLHTTVGRQYPWQPSVKMQGFKQDSDYLDFEPN